MVAQPSEKNFIVQSTPAKERIAETFNQEHRLKATGPSAHTPSQAPPAFRQTLSYAPSKSPPLPLLQQAALHSVKGNACQKG